jgi:hypothetical protein
MGCLSLVLQGRGLDKREVSTLVRDFIVLSLMFELIVVEVYLNISTDCYFNHSTCTLDHTLILLKYMVNEHVFMNLVSFNITISLH